MVIHKILATILGGKKKPLVLEEGQAVLFVKNVGCGFHIFAKTNLRVTLLFEVNFCVDGSGGDTF